MTIGIQEVLQRRKAELAAAKSEYLSWSEYDARREDGSSAQDRRHEERGEALLCDLHELEQAVRHLQAQLG